jgi:hypothetical protein
MLLQICARLPRFPGDGLSRVIPKAEAGLFVSQNSHKRGKAVIGDEFRFTRSSPREFLDELCGFSLSTRLPELPIHSVYVDLSVSMSSTHELIGIGHPAREI